MSRREEREIMHLQISEGASVTLTGHPESTTEEHHYEICSLCRGPIEAVRSVKEALARPAWMDER